MTIMKIDIIKYQCQTTQNSYDRVAENVGAFTFLVCSTEGTYAEGMQVKRWLMYGASPYTALNN